MKEFKVIQIKISEFDGRMYGDSYEYVSKIITNTQGNIEIITCEDPLNAMKFNTWGDEIENVKKVRNQLLELVKSYFPKKDHTISYHEVKVVY